MKRPGEAGPPRLSASRDVDDELRFHLEGRVEELMAQGLSEQEARARALEAFGDMRRVRDQLRAIDMERSREWRRRGWLMGWWRDLRTGARRLRRNRGYAFVAVATMALGIGASVAMFTVLNAVVLRPLPYVEPDRLVKLWPAQNANISLSRELGASLGTVSSVTGLSRWSLTLTGEGDAVMVRAAVVDAGYFDVFAVRPQPGRAFNSAETSPDRSAVVLLAHGFWQSRFGGDPGVIGRRIRLSGYDHEEREIIGVMPAGHQTLLHDVDVWIPLHLAAGHTVASDSSWYVNDVIARLAPGATVERADTEIKSVAARLATQYPGRLEEENVQAASVVALREAVVGDVRSTLWILFGAVGLVLLIACGNLANLLLARTGSIRRELAVQAALGASRGRLVRQQLLESTLIAAFGGGLGVVLAFGLLSAVHVAEASGLPRVDGLAPDVRVLTFAVVVTVAALLLSALLPALRATAGHIRDELHGGVRGGSRNRSTHRLNRALVASELAMATVLTAAAGLVLTSFATLRAVDPGIDPADVLTVEVMAPADRYSGERLTQYHAEVMARLRALPGVTAVGGIHLLPFTVGNWSFPYLAEGHAPPANAPLPAANFRMITPGYLETVDQRLVAGRDFTDADREGGERVMLVNRALAELLWPGEEAVGRQIRLFGNMTHRIVGVVGDVRQFKLDMAPLPELYVPVAQWSRGGAAMVITVEGPRATRLVAEARAAVSSVDRDVPILHVRPLTEVLGDSMARDRFTALALASFGALALLLGAFGVYGVMSHLVGARMPDFGLRMALGARTADIRRETLRAGLVPAGFGLVAGLGAAVLAGRFLRGLLFGVPAVHPPTLLAATVLLLTTALLACWLPARRAGRSDPLTVLRAD